MTDTTDIKALRDAATKYAKSLEAHIRTPLDHDLFRAMDLACWELTGLIGNNELSVVINLLDQLESERQRADDEAALNKHLDLAIRQSEGVNANLRRLAEKAEAELAALKAKLANPVDLHPTCHFYGNQYLNKRATIAAIITAGFTVKE